jgi:hypothetical protein
MMKRIDQGRHLSFVISDLSLVIVLKEENDKSEMTNDK